MGNCLTTELSTTWREPTPMKHSYILPVFADGPGDERETEDKVGNREDYDHKGRNDGQPTQKTILGAQFFSQEPG